MSRQRCVIFGIVMLAVMLCAGVASAGMTVRIIEPCTDPFDVVPGVEQEFEAVAVIDGEELPAGEVTWEWDFGDETDVATTNPALHTYAEEGNYTVTVTATCGSLSGQDQSEAQVDEGGGGGNNNFMFQHGPTGGGEECDAGGVGICGRNVNRFRVKIFRSFKDHPEALIGETWSSDPWTQDGITYRFAGQPEYWMGYPNAAILFRFEVYWEDGSRGPEVSGSFNTNDTLVETTGDLLMLHDPADPAKSTHTIGWSVSHMNHLDPRFRVRVEVLDLGGGIIWSHEVEQGITSGTVTWSGQRMGMPGGGDAAKGLYSFRVRADHRDPQNPSSLLVPSCSDVNVADIISIDDVQSRLTWPNHALPWARVEIDFSLSTAVPSIAYKVFDPKLEAWVDGSIAGPFAAGSHTREISFPVPARDDNKGWGAYTIVLQTTEADGSNNRNLQPKPAVPKGRAVNFSFGARYVYIYNNDPPVGHAAAGESALQGWPHTYIFGWYPGNENPLIPALGDMRLARPGPGADPLTTAIEHDAGCLDRAFELPTGGPQFVADRAFAYVEQGNPEAVAKFWMFVTSSDESEATEDLYGAEGETSKMWDLYQVVGVHCAGFASDVSGLSMFLAPPTNPWHLGEMIVSEHFFQGIGYPTGWWTDNGALAAHGCSSCKHARGEE